ncbi:rplF [Scenedesmus sp. PABB004]|nr:rplF [Scenedesmus sp. PABB004]
MLPSAALGAQRAWAAGGPCLVARCLARCLAGGPGAHAGRDGGSGGAEISAAARRPQRQQEQQGQQQQQQQGQQVQQQQQQQQQLGWPQAAAGRHEHAGWWLRGAAGGVLQSLRAPARLPPLPAAAEVAAAAQLQLTAGLRQLAPHGAAPRPLPRFRKPARDGRINRMVIRVPPQVDVALQGGALTLTGAPRARGAGRAARRGDRRRAARRGAAAGARRPLPAGRAGKAGSTSLPLSFLDPTGLVAWQCHAQSAADAAAGPGTGSLLLLASPSKRCWRGIQTHIDNAVHGVTQGYLVGLTVQGVGYRMEPVPDATVAAALAARRGDADAAGGAAAPKRRIIWEAEAEKSTITYPHKAPARAVRLKVGYTRACIFPLPPGVLGFFVKPTLMYLYGTDKATVTNAAAAIRAVRKPNPYTGNGIQRVGEALRLKQRAGSKRGKRPRGALCKQLTFTVTGGALPAAHALAPWSRVLLAHPALADMEVACKLLVACAATRATVDARCHGLEAVVRERHAAYDRSPLPLRAAFQEAGLAFVQCWLARHAHLLRGLTVADACARRELLAAQPRAPCRHGRRAAGCEVLAFGWHQRQARYSLQQLLLSGEPLARPAPPPPRPEAPPALAALTMLRSLRLSVPPAADEEGRQLRRALPCLSALTALALNTLDGLACLPTSLRALSLGHAVASPRPLDPGPGARLELGHLSGVTSLRHYDAATFTVQLRAGDALPPSVEELDVADAPTLAPLLGLSRLSALSVSPDHEALPPRELHALAALPRLRRVELECRGAGEGELGPLAPAWAALPVVALADVPLAPSLLPHLARARLVTRLSCTGVACPSVGAAEVVAALSALTLLEHLDLGAVDVTTPRDPDASAPGGGAADEDEEDEDGGSLAPVLAAVSALPRLRSLVVSWSTLDGDAAAALAAPRLTRLALEQCELAGGDATAAALVAGLPALTHLDCVRSDWTDGPLPRALVPLAVAALPALASLRLPLDLLTDAAVDALRGAGALRALHVVYNYRRTPEPGWRDALERSMPRCTVTWQRWRLMCC